MCRAIEGIKKRAKRKFLNTPVINALVALNSPLKESYESTYKCCSTIAVSDGKTKSRYCKRVWCSVCNPIRTAVRLNNYSKPLADLGGLQLTTLTISNVPGSELKATIIMFRQAFRKYRDMLRKQGRTFRGVYNFEITINYKTRLYHPHIHIIHEAGEVFKKPSSSWRPKSQYYNELIEYWLQCSPKSDMKAQDVRECKDLIEGFKYAGKTVFKAKQDGETVSIIPAIELDTMYQAIKGVRMFQPFGLSKVEIDEDKAMDELTAQAVDVSEGAYKWQMFDWVNVVTGELLSGFIPPENIVEYWQALNKNSGYSPPHWYKRVNVNFNKLFRNCKKSETENL